MSRRAELRRDQKKKDPTYTLTASQIQKIKDDVRKEAIDVAFILMLGLPTIILHDHYGKLMKKEGRENTFVDLVLDLYDGFNKGYITLEDNIEALREEANVSIDYNRLKNRQNKFIKFDK